MNNLVVIIGAHTFINPSEIYVKSVCGATGRTEGRIVIVGTSGNEAYHDYRFQRDAFTELERVSKEIARGVSCITIDLDGEMGAIV